MKVITNADHIDWWIDKNMYHKRMLVAFLIKIKEILPYYKTPEIMHLRYAEDTMYKFIDLLERFDLFWIEED